MNLWNFIPFIFCLVTKQKKFKLLWKSELLRVVFEKNYVIWIYGIFLEEKLHTYNYLFSFLQKKGIFQTIRIRALLLEAYFKQKRRSELKKKFKTQYAILRFQYTSNHIFSLSRQTLCVISSSGNNSHGYNQNTMMLRCGNVKTSDVSTKSHGKHNIRQ